MNITIGLHILPQGGNMQRMRETWMEAEALGVDRLYTADHFHSQIFTSDAAVEQKHTAIGTGKNFEATAIQAAMAATTTRAEIGHLEADDVEYGYPYGTAKSRVLDLARDVPIITARLDKLNPKPPRKIPIMIASMGGEIGMRTVAAHADIWHVYGTLEKIRDKTQVLDRMRQEIGRDPASMVKLGICHIIATSFGPDWDLGAVRELLAWRRNLSE
jgi:alkanesulfonate monooxygenase SsuD/methylene tetrahydromethanopterin reductase-like flavin-dependent oxidoreductase (luciferase family)